MVKIIITVLALVMMAARVVSVQGCADPYTPPDCAGVKDPEECNSMPACQWQWAVIHRRKLQGSSSCIPKPDNARKPERPNACLAVRTLSRCPSRVVFSSAYESPVCVCFCMCAASQIVIRLEMLPQRHATARQDARGIMKLTRACTSGKQYSSGSEVRCDSCKWKYCTCMPSGQWEVYNYAPDDYNSGIVSLLHIYVGIRHHLTDCCSLRATECSSGCECAHCPVHYSHHLPAHAFKPY
eukprot:12162-Heterococcus_DN1.PRE.4